MLVPRCVYPGLEESVTLYVIHGFGDASEKAYCAVVYLLLEVTDDSFQLCCHPRSKWHR